MGVWYFLKLVFPVVLAYAGLYALGAMAYLILFRYQIVDGVLRIKTKSMAYLLTYPVRYAKGVSAGISSNCAFYARLFNMLVFFWPFVLTYFIVAIVTSAIFGILISGYRFTPNFTEEFWVEIIPIFRYQKFPPILITFPLLLIIGFVFKTAKILAFLKVFGWILLCLLPPILLITAFISALIVVFVIYPEEKNTNGVIQYLQQRKNKFCRKVEFR